MKLTTWLPLLVVAFPVLLAGCGGGEPMPGVGPLDADTDGYGFQIRAPAELDPEEDYQLVIAFHDNGQSERQVTDWWDQGMLDEPDFILLALRAPFLGERGYAWLPRDADPGSDTDRVAACRTAEDVLAEGIEAVTSEYAIDEEDIILLGAGGGCNIALWMALTDPRLFDGLALLGGAGIPDWVPGVRSGNAGHLDVFITADPVHRPVADETAERFRRAGATVEVHATPSGRPDGAEALQEMERFFGLTYLGDGDELDSLPEEE
jgi:predicted esterase